MKSYKLLAATLISRSIIFFIACGGGANKEEKPVAITERNRKYSDGTCCDEYVCPVQPGIIDMVFEKIKRLRIFYDSTHKTNSF